MPSRTAAPADGARGARKAGAIAAKPATGNAIPPTSASSLRTAMSWCTANPASTSTRSAATNAISQRGPPKPNSASSSNRIAGTASEASAISHGRVTKRSKGEALPTRRPAPRTPSAIWRTSSTLVAWIERSPHWWANGRRYTTRTLRSRTPSR